MLLPVSHWTPDPRLADGLRPRQGRGARPTFAAGAPRAAHHWWSDVAAAAVPPVRRTRTPFRCSSPRSCDRTTLGLYHGEATGLYDRRRRPGAATREAWRGRSAARGRRISPPLRPRAVAARRPPETDVGVPVIRMLGSATSSPALTRPGPSPRPWRRRRGATHSRCCAAPARGRPARSSWGRPRPVLSSAACRSPGCPELAAVEVRSASPGWVRPSNGVFPAVRCRGRRLGPDGAMAGLLAGHAVGPSPPGPDGSVPAPIAVAGVIQPRSLGDGLGASGREHRGGSSLDATWPASGRRPRHGCARRRRRDAGGSDAPTPPASAWPSPSFAVVLARTADEDVWWLGDDPRRCCCCTRRLESRPPHGRGDGHGRFAPSDRAPGVVAPRQRHPWRRTAPPGPMGWAGSSTACCTSSAPSAVVGALVRRRSGLRCHCPIAPRPLTSPRCCSSG